MTDGGGGWNKNCKDGSSVDQTPQEKDTGCQLSAANISYDDRNTGVGCSHVQCAIDAVNDRVTGSTDHPNLGGRHLPEQHPQSAITDLEADQATQDQAIGDNTAAIGVVVADLATHEARIDNPHSVTPGQIGAAEEIHTHVLSDVLDSGSMAAVDDAPADGKQYARKDDAWSEVEAGGGGVVPLITIYETPGTPTHSFAAETAWARVYVTGGGGGDETPGGTPAAGGSGATGIKVITKPAGNASLVIGQGGIRGAAPGGSSSYSDGVNIISAAGGINSWSDRTTSIEASGGDINIPGGAGQYGPPNSSNNEQNYQGGASFWGAGKHQETTGPSAWGSGASSRGSGDRAADGAVVIEEYQ